MIIWKCLLRALDVRILGSAIGRFIGKVNAKTIFIHASYSPLRRLLECSLANLFASSNIPPLHEFLDFFHSFSHRIHARPMHI